MAKEVTKRSQPLFYTLCVIFSPSQISGKRYLCNRKITINTKNTSNEKKNAFPDDTARDSCHDTNGPIHAVAR